MTVIDRQKDHHVTQIDQNDGAITATISTSGTHSVAVLNGCEVVVGVDANRMIRYQPWPGHICESLAN